MKRASPSCLARYARLQRAVGPIATSSRRMTERMADEIDVIDAQPPSDGGCPSRASFPWRARLGARKNPCGGAHIHGPIDSSGVAVARGRVDVVHAVRSNTRAAAVGLVLAARARAAARACGRLMPGASNGRRWIRRDLTVQHRCMKIPRFGLNRFDSRSVDVLPPTSSARRRSLGRRAPARLAAPPPRHVRDAGGRRARAARITLGTLLANPSTAIRA